MHRKILSIMLASVVLLSFIVVDNGFCYWKARSLRIPIAENRDRMVSIASNTTVTKEEADEFAKLMRYYILRSLYLAGSGHASTSLSDVEINMALYALGGIHVDPKDPLWDYRDRFVTKGHTYPGIYAMLAQMGFFPTGDLDEVRSLGSHLSGHVTVNTPGIDANTGILGQSLSIALGIAINAKLEGTDYTTFCNIGDAETQEGQIFAAAEASSFLNRQGKMGKLVAFIDHNKAGRDGWVEDYGTVNIKEKWQAAGWQVLEVENGHDPFAIKNAIDYAKKNKERPTLIICTTQKGKGVSFLSEGDKAFERHGTPPNSAKEYFQALKEILGEEIADRKQIEIGTQELEIDDKEQTLEKLFDMKLIESLVTKIQKQNKKYRTNLEAKQTEPNPHLQPTEWEWDGKPIQQYEPGSKIATRLAAGEFFLDLIQQNPQLRDRLIFLTMDLKVSQGLHLVTKEVPEMDYMLGIREDVTASAATGISLASKGRIVPVVGTFAAFLLNMSPQLRMAQQTPGVKFIVYMSHTDALDVGEDGPTHQPEFAAGISLNLGLSTIIPSDGNTMWNRLSYAVDTTINDPNAGVTFIGGVRSSSYVYDFDLPYPAVDIFSVWESEGIDDANKPDGIIVAMGPAMLNMSIQAAKSLHEDGKKIRVVCIEHLSEVGKKGSAFYGLIEPGVPIVTAHDGLKETLGGVLSNALTSLSEDFGRIPRVESVGIHAISATHQIAKGISYRGERGQALEAYDLYGMGPKGIANTMSTMIESKSMLSLARNHPATDI